MAIVHFLNVGKGDSTIIKHNSGHVSMIDICKGRCDTTNNLSQSPAERLADAKLGEFRMSERPTNPLDYLNAIGVTSIFRFILTHPDMDHLDGFDLLSDKLQIQNFWDSGVRRDSPDFDECKEYDASDWDRYLKVIEGKEPGISVAKRSAGDKFKFANQTDTGDGGDGLYILAPNKILVADGTESGDMNDASYMILYSSPGGKILIPGDAHNDTWEFVLKNYRKTTANCDVLFAPHHGRRSAADFSFLDVVKPKITFFGCATDGHLAHHEWDKRKLPVITNNDAGNIVLETDAQGIDIYVENAYYAASQGCDLDITNEQGFIFVGHVQ